MGLISFPQIDTRGIKLRIILGEIILDSREEVRMRKEGVYLEDTNTKGIPFEMIGSLTKVSLLQV